MSKNNTKKSARNDLAGGVILILIGVVYMLNEFFNFNLGQYTWPFFVIVPGLLVFIFALTLKAETGKWFATVGSIIAMAGILLLYQNIFNHFESWAYAWSLLVPTGLGLGQIVFGSLKGLDEYAQAGKLNMKRGMTIFVIGFVFFELVIGISGFGLSAIGLGKYTWPMLLIGLGLYVLLRGSLSNLRSYKSQPVTNNHVE